MASSLIKVDEFTISSPVASVILGGGSSGSSGLNASIDSTYDVYMVAINNLVGANDSVLPYLRITVGGTPDVTSNFRRANVEMISNAAFVYNGYNVGQNFMYLTSGETGTGTSETANGNLFLFNFNNSGEYNFGTMEMVTVTDTQVLESWTGGFVHTVAQSADGIQFYMSAGNIAGGTFTLYGLAK